MIYLTSRNSEWQLIYGDDSGINDEHLQKINFYMNPDIEEITMKIISIIDNQLFIYWFSIYLFRILSIPLPQ